MQQQKCYCLKMQSFPILYEDDNLLIINKQSGIAVQGGEEIFHSVDKLLSEQMNQKIYLVHRLDKDTAGILVTAKNPRTAAEYTKMFAEKYITKEYMAFCTGCPSPVNGKICYDIEHKGIRKQAVTYYKTMKCEKKQINGQNYNFSMLKLSLATGRMHQIRIHLQKTGTPIIADDKYGDFSINRLLKKEFGIKKLQLSAVKLTLPINGKPAEFEISLPTHMQEADKILFQ